MIASSFRSYISAICLGALLVGCGNQQQSNPWLGIARGVASSALPAGQSAEAESAAPARQSAAQLRGAIAGGALQQIGRPVALVELQESKMAAIFTLAGLNGRAFTYLSPDRVSITLKDGILVATRGFYNDLMSADISEVRAAVLAGNGSTNREFRHLNGLDQIVTSMFTCSYSRESQTTTEICENPEHRIENAYFTQGNKIIRSLQWVSPGLGMIQIEEYGL